MRKKILLGGLLLMLLVVVTSVGTCLFLAFRPEGTFTAAVSSAPAESRFTLKVLSWNVLQSGDRMLGAPWAQRRESFQALLQPGAYDVVCLQEALPEQVAFFSSLLAGHHLYGVGRDDGKAKGEHCPIYYNGAKFALRDSGTFWISPTPEKPSTGWGENVPRVCSWVELEDRATLERFRVYNLHLQLHALAQPEAATAVRAQLKGLSVPAVIVGDFNAPHCWPAMRILETAGYTNADSSSALTYHVKGKGVRCLDHILTDSHWHVARGGILKEKGGAVFPSDHFGLWAELALR